ncbi:MAG: hypothetical protein AB7P02_29215 [Alphaproteobacteria bacterium]
MAAATAPAPVAATFVVDGAQLELRDGGALRRDLRWGHRIVAHLPIDAEIGEAEAAALFAAWRAHGHELLPRDVDRVLGEMAP